MAQNVQSSPACKHRTLRLESLEQRALLSVTTLGETFKSFDFTGSAAISAKWNYQAPGYPRYAIPFDGKATFEGTANYDSSTHGNITVSGIIGSGTWKTPIKNGTFQLTDGAITDGIDNKGAFSGNATAKLSVSTFGDKDLSGPVTGSISGPKQTLTANYREGDLSLTLSGVFVPKVDPSDATFGIVIEKTEWLADKSGLQVDVKVPGPVHKSASYSAPAVAISLYWAKGTSYNARLGQPLIDKIPIEWNEASGSYLVKNFSAAPASATHLLLVAKFDGKQVVRAVQLPARPSLSISDIQVSKGTSGMTAATFTVTLSEAAYFPVKVSYATANGSARSPLDYKGIPRGTVTFAAGETQKTITVLVKGNTKVTADKTFFVRLKSPAGATLADAEGKGTITSVQPIAADMALQNWATVQAEAKLAWYFATSHPSHRSI